MAKNNEDIVNTFTAAAENVDAFKKMFDRLRGIECRVLNRIECIENELKTLKKVATLEITKGAAYSAVMAAIKENEETLDSLRLIIGE